MRFLREPALFIVSYAIPPVMAPSPMTAMHLFLRLSIYFASFAFEWSLNFNKNDNHAVLEVARTIHGFIRHTSSYGTITNDGNAGVILALVEHALANTLPILIPCATEIIVDECPAPKLSYSDSLRLQNKLTPPAIDWKNSR